MMKPKKKAKAEVITTTIDGKVLPPKYGPLTIHQNGTAVKLLAATAMPVVAKASHVAHALENVRLSLHVERFESVERLSADIWAITRFPEYGFEVRHKTPCEMRVGQTHGAAVVQATCICLDFPDAHDTNMEVEYFLGEESLAKIDVAIKFPEATAAESDSDSDGDSE